MYPDTIAAEAPTDARAAFIRRTYAHLLGAILAFAALEVLFFNVLDVAAITQTMLSGQYTWLIVLGAFIFVSYIAEAWARSATSLGTQYAGLGLYVVAEAIIFMPLLYVAARFGGPNVIPTAALITLVMFAGLTGIVFITARDFSFLRPAIYLGGLGAMGLIVCGAIFGFTLGPIFTVAMIVLACGYILYHTSNVLHHYRVTQHVAASLALFASVMLLFWYVIRLVMAMSRR